MKILIADESPLIRQVINRILSFHYIKTEVYEAETTEEVIEIIKTFHPEIIIIDISGFKISLDEIHKKISLDISSILIIISLFSMKEILLPEGLKDYKFLKKEELNLLPSIINEFLNC
jgi:chemotaxis response regulator CheB